MPSSTTTDSSAAAELLGVSKSYHGRQVVKSVDLSVEQRSFFSILGPSGCGKTSTLRMLAGFLRPDSGDIRIKGESVAAVPPHKRDVNTVFQSYALFSHLSVQQNIGFGLKRKRVPKAAAQQRVAHMLDVVSLADRADARPSELSGGQQQRVALARALVNMPGLLLLDEPLGALDLKLRRQMQVELKAIQREVGVAFVYVTHDQEEALTMSDRIAVMNDGRILQIGTPAEIYEQPASLFVAEFIGSTNSLHGLADDRGVLLDCGASVPAAVGIAPGDEVIACIRPEKVVLQDAIGDRADGGVRGTIVEAVYLGSGVAYRVLTASGVAVRAHVPAGSGEHASRPVGEQVDLRWLPQDCLMFLADGARPAVPAPTSVR
jgi:spermidine/putrescine transport system ATP-binding protein